MKIQYQTAPEMGIPIQAKTSQDGTNYEIIAIQITTSISAGYMCNTPPIWLIISCYDKTAYTFSANKYLSWDYVAEKLTPKGSRKDAQNLTELIKQVTGIP